MRRGDVQIDDWEVSDVEIDGETGVRLDMWSRSDRQLTVHLRREGNVLYPWYDVEATGSEGLVDAEMMIAEQILESRDYEIAEEAIWE